MNRNEVAEQKLVARALVGDSVSFGRLYEWYLDEIYQYVFYRVKSHQEAEDLTETIFLKAWEALGQNPPQEIPFRIWLYRIGRNTVIDHYRTRKEKVSLEAAMDVPEAKDGPESLVVRQEQAEDLRTKLQALNDDHQEVLTCRFVMGLTHAETAVVMSRSEEAVRALQYRAINALRDMLTVEQATSPPYFSKNGNGTLSETTKKIPINGVKSTKEEGKNV